MEFIHLRVCGNRRSQFPWPPTCASACPIVVRNPSKGLAAWLAICPRASKTKPTTDVKVAIIQQLNLFPAAGTFSPTFVLKIAGLLRVCVIFSEEFGAVSAARESAPTHRSCPSLSKSLSPVVAPVVICFPELPWLKRCAIGATK